MFIQNPIILQKFNACSNSSFPEYGQVAKSVFMLAAQCLVLMRNLCMKAAAVQTNNAIHVRLFLNRYSKLAFVFEDIFISPRGSFLDNEKTCLVNTSRLISINKMLHCRGGGGT